MGWRDKGRPIDAEWPRWYWPGRKRAFGNFFRAIRTTQERREFGPEFGRVKRSPRRLPTAWDDIIRGDYRHRSWKRHRATQYRPTNEAPTMSVVSENHGGPDAPEIDAGHAARLPGAESYRRTGAVVARIVESDPRRVANVERARRFLRGPDAPEIDLRHRCAGCGRSLPGERMVDGKAEGWLCLRCCAEKTFGPPSTAPSYGPALRGAGDERAGAGVTP